MLFGERLSEMSNSIKLTPRSGSSNSKGRENKNVSISNSKKQSLFKLISKYRFLYLLLLPGFIYYVVFRYIPLSGTIVAFKDVKPFEGLEAMVFGKWVGFYHFQRFLQSRYFWNILSNTFILAGLRMIFEFLAPIAFALLINEIVHKRYKKVVQSISYMPFFVSNVVLAGLVFTMLSLDSGIIPEIVKCFGGEPLFYIGDVRYFRTILIVALMWKNIGWGSIIYLAALATIDPQLYEAARIDGAGKWEQLKSITLPSISYAIVIMFILRISVIMNEGYKETLLLYSPAVYEVSDIIDTYVFRVGLQQMKYSFATAVGLFKSLMTLIMVLGANWLMKRLDEENIFA